MRMLFIFVPWPKNVIFHSTQPLKILNFLVNEQYYRAFLFLLDFSRHILSVWPSIIVKYVGSSVTTVLAFFSEASEIQNSIDII